MSEPKWERVCVLCAGRGRKQRLENGHVCTECAAWLMRSVAEIARLCADAALSIEPGSTSSGGSGAFGSKPPCRVDAIDPELTMLELNAGDPTSAVTILEALEMWERLVREERGMAPYGPASAHRAARIMGAGNSAHSTSVTLTGVVGFLGSAVPWMIDAPDWPIDEFADHIRRSVMLLGRWDVTRQASGYAVPCPTILEPPEPDPEADPDPDEPVSIRECGYMLRYWDASEAVTCRRCHATRSASQLVTVVLSGEDRAIWVDPEAAAAHYGVSERELRRWASKGHVKRSHGRYLLSDITKEVSA